ncbi:hypothetical protein J2X46_002678 [Nocardioides sp. BE266]|uniref:hypothetical protein n=1 Tax=Nocardioides sp. BE266 TaxID=2817725 RepID=UPI002865F5EA|nr:hypothetical protein [Nocardioides sp. BE266]MDR7253688.1 hypothetical protein [Nocardioides sp. BE266]
MALTISAAAAQAMGAALATDIGSAATIEIRTGTKPATPETAASGTLLATVTISGSFTSTSGALTAADPASVTVAASGTAGHFRVKTSGGTAKIDGTVGTSGADMNLSTTALVAGGTVDLGVPTFTIPTS